MLNDYVAFDKQRSKILEQMAALDRMERGRLFEQFFKGQKDGHLVSWGPYYVLQRRVGRKVLKQRVPAERLSSVQDDIHNHEQFLKLAERFTELTEAMTRLQDANPELKKKPRPTRTISSKKPRPSSF
jgi:hypothetical protein